MDNVYMYELDLTDLNPQSLTYGHILWWAGRNDEVKAMVKWNEMVEYAQRNSPCSITFTDHVAERELTTTY